MKKSTFIVVVILLVLALTSMQGFAQGASQPQSRMYGKGAPFQIEDLPPGQLRWALEALPAAAKSRAMENLHSFSFPHQDIDSLRVDSQGGIFYICNIEVDNATVADETAAVAPALSFDPSKAFLLHSRPNSPNKVFLNFQGGVISGTAWSSATLNAVPYDTDGNPAVFSDAERRVIADVWHRVAEDYEPFDIDVTTERPASFGPKVGHVMITKDTDANGAAMPAKGAGGVAYVGVWGYSNYATTYSPAFVYFNNLGTTVAHYISEAASHEFGHNLSLSHDGTSTTGYYQGLGTGNVSWGPIMGVGYYTQVTQWSKGEYPDANNHEDDIAIIASKVTFRPDGHGNSMATAAMLAVDPDGTVWSSNPEDDPDNIYPENKGVIEQAADVDFFAFDHAGGAISFTVKPAWEAFETSKRGANLDIQAILYDSLGNIIASSDPLNDTFASVSATVGAGRCYLAITGVGNSVTPYSDYGSIGQYFINGTVTTSALQADFTFTTAGLTADFTDTSTDSSGTINSRIWDFGDGHSSTLQNPSNTYASGGSYTVTLTVTDNSGSTGMISKVVTVTAPNVSPTAGFTFSTSGLTATFTDTSFDSDGSIASWSWSFGDGTSSTIKNPSHTYSAGGSYTVTLTVTDNRGATGTISKVVTVTAFPAAPSNLTATVITSGTARNRTKTVTLKWQDNSQNESGFNIERCTQTTIGKTKVCSFSDRASVGPNITTFTEIPGSGTYKYRVRAWNASGSSGYSNEVKIQ